MNPAQHERMQTPLERYRLPAVAAHWLIFLLLIGSFTLGFTMTGMALSPAKLRYFSWHKWIGVTVFLLVLLRLAWRAYAKPPSLPPMPAWQVQASQISHHLLYVLLLALPLTGWLMSSAKGFQTVYFGKIAIPDLIGKNPPLGAALEAVHEALAFLMLGVLALHVLAALKHHFIDRDAVLARMLPGLKPPGGP